MMTLSQAIESGKKFTRQSFLEAGENEYYDAEVFVSNVSLGDITATDYVLAADELTWDVLADIWNRNKLSSTPSASESKFFGKIVSELTSLGIMKVG